MTLPTLDTPSFLGGFGKGLGEGLKKSTKSIQDLILSREKQKINDLLSLEKRREATIKRLPSYLKEFYPSLYENPEAKKKLLELVKNYPDMADSEAIESAIKEYRQPKKSTGLSQGTQNQDKLTQPENIRDFLGDILTRAQQTPAPEHPMTILERERPGGTLASLGLGAVAPFEEILRGQSKSGREFMESLGFTYPEGSKRGPLITEQLRERLHQGLSPEAQRATQFPEMVGAFLPIERVLGGLKAIGKSAGFLKNVEKIAAREGIEVTDAAQRIVKEAEGAGINLEKAAAGDKQEAGKLFNFSNRISREAPKTGTEMRVARTEPPTKMFPKEERIATRESQLKAFPKYEAEIAKDASERAARAEDKIPKTVKGMDARRLRVHAAEKNLPVAEEGYRKATARVRALEDEIASMKSPKDRVEGLLEAAKGELRDSEFFLKQTMQNIAGGEARTGLAEMRKAAQEKMIKIADEISAGEEVKLAKMDYNPQMIQEAKRLEKRKPLPAVKQDDFYQQVHKEYGDQYRNQLARIEKELKQIPKTMSEAERIRNLQKEKGILQKLIDQTEAERIIHRHKLALRETAERQKAKERLAQFQKQEAQPKIQKVAQEKIKENVKEYISKPTPENIEKIAAETGAPKEGVKQGKSLVDAIKEVNESAAKGTRPKFGRLQEEFEKFKTAMKVKDFRELGRNPFSVGIAQIIADYLLNETDILDTVDIPGGVSTLSTIAAGGRARNFWIRSGILMLYRTALNNYKISNYVDAVKKGDDKKVSKLQKEYPSKLIKKARLSLSQEE